MKCPLGNSNWHASSSLKPSLRQIAFDGALSTPREGVHEAVLVVALGALDRLGGRRHSDAAALELGHDHPADLVDPLVAPLPGPVADRADAGAARGIDDLEHSLAILEALVAAL